MAELTQKELLQPSLLDRLKDDEPEKKGAEAREKRIFSYRKLKQSVLRDLGWLLNTGCLETCTDLAHYPEVRSSVLNFGIQDLTGTCSSNADSAHLEQFLRQAILNFEPRILPASLKINWIDPDKHEMSRDYRQPNTIAFEIECDLWAEPAPERLYLKTVLDLELGDFEVREQ